MSEESRNGDGVLSLDLCPQELEIELKHKDGPKRYVITEASEDTVVQWQNCIIRAQTQEGDRLTFGNVADADPLLVSMCLFELRPQPKGEGPPTRVRVSGVEIRKWPGRTVRFISDKIKEISNLTDKNAIDPKLIVRARKDLAQDHHPDRGGNPEVMRGVNIALDWLAKHSKEQAAAEKNSSSAGTDTSAWRENYESLSQS